MDFYTRLKSNKEKKKRPAGARGWCTSLAQLANCARRLETPLSPGNREVTMWVGLVLESVPRPSRVPRPLPLVTPSLTQVDRLHCTGRGTSLIRNCNPRVPYRGTSITRNRKSQNARSLFLIYGVLLRNSVRTHGVPFLVMLENH